MKTLKLSNRGIFKICRFSYFLISLLIIGCSKDDGPPLKEEEEIKLSSAKEITSFVFLLADNPLDVNVVANINEETKAITAEMPAGTSLLGLLPEIKISNQATIDIDSAQDFSSPLQYTVTAEDGSTVVYTVTLTALLTQRQILQAILDANPENTLPWDLENTAELDSLVGVTTNVEGRIIELEMDNKNLNKLPTEIEQLTNLTELRINANKFSSFPLEVIQLTNLTSLYLFFNPLTSIPLEIGQLTNLANLGLGNTQLTNLPPEIGQLTNLTSLSLGDSQLTSIPSEIGQLTNLTSLGLNNNQLTSIPLEIGQLTNLTYLGLSNNQITSIPLEIGQLTNLTSLFLSRNQITSIPLEIGQLTNLTSLFLSRNQITSLPAEIGQLLDLDLLFLDGNKLTSIPPEMGFLRNFLQIDLRENNLSVIPQAICNIVMGLSAPDSLQISLDDNVTCETVSQKDALISIYTANPDNTLEWGVNDYPEVTFNTNGNPTVINLNNKGLTKILENIGQLTALETLNANGNNLESLPNTLSDIASLNVVNVDGNQLSTVPSQLGQLNNLALLTLTNNPITSIPQEVCDLQTSNGGILTLLTDAGEGCN